jgi:truncated hemoglobin YjbI
MACPITGLTADGNESEHGIVASAELAKLEADPDIIEERQTLEQGSSPAKVVSGSEAALVSAPAPMVQHHVPPNHFVPLNVLNRKHQPNQETKRLVRAVGLPTLRRFTALFYEKCEANAHLDQFIRRHSDPHSERFALWIMEKFGDGTPWTDERRTRNVDTMRIGHEVVEVAYDRSSAHFAAWYSPKRAAHQRGQHFQLDDARVWMRLHFWAARDAGLFEPEHAAFMDYYTRFIGHFVSVYSSKSPPFTRESARWSADPENIERYFGSKNVMTDVLGVPLGEALEALPPHERLYTGSGHQDSSWPYEL